MIYVENRSPRRLCEAVAKVADSKLARRPFNRFKPVETSWWLVPSPAMPFYRFGKFCFCWDEKKMDYIDCGYYVEKGIDPSLKSVFTSAKGKKLLMNSSWAWPDFLAFCNKRELEKALEKISADSANSLPVYLKVAGGYVDDPTLYDPHSEKTLDDYFVFELSAADRSLKVVEARRKSLQLKIFNRVKSLDQFVAALNSLDQEHFMWLRIFIFSRFAIENSNSDAIVDSWGSDKIYSSLLQPFNSVMC